MYVTFILNCPQPYSVDNTTYPRHVHYTVLTEDDVWSTNIGTLEIMCKLPFETMEEIVKKKTYLILCILGVFLPYYNLINFLKINDWSMNGFFELLFSNYAVSMISMDLSVAASTFLIFIIAKFWKRPKRLLRYIVPLFLVGFSLSLPLYLYDNSKF